MARVRKKLSVLRFLTRSIVAVLVLIGIALMVLLFLPTEKIAQIASDRFEAATGRTLSVQGDVRPAIWPQIGVKTGPVSVANADWSQQGPMLTAESVSVGVDLRALIAGDIQIRHIEIVDPEVLLEIAADGQTNWTFDQAAPTAGNATTESGEIPAFSLDRATISNGSVTFLDNRTAARHSVAALNASITLPDFEGVANVSANGVVNGQAVSLETEISAFSAFLSDGSVPITVAAVVGASKIALDGRAGLVPLAGSGRLDADLGDMAAVFGALGMATPDIPRGLGQSVGLSGDVTYTNQQLSLRAGTIQLDQNRLVGEADLNLAGKPDLTGKFGAGALDLSSLGGSGPGARGASGGGQSATGWSKTPIDISALNLLDAEIVVQADSVALGPSNLGRTRIFSRLQDNRIEINIQELNAYDGAVSGMFVVNGRGGMSVRADLEGRSIALKPLLSQIAGYDRLIAAGNMEIDVLGSGNNMHAIMNSLNGGGSFEMSAGELFGLDLVGMLRNFDASYVGEDLSTIFDSIKGTFLVKDGVIINDNLLFASKFVSAQGSGQVGLGQQTLNYRLAPKLLTGEGKGLTVPLIITGSWANPKFRLDLESLADQKLNIETEKLEDRAKDAVSKALEKQLGVTKEDGQSTEDLLRDKLEQRAKDKLLDLLGGN